MSQLSSFSNDNIVLPSSAEPHDKGASSQMHMVTSPITGEVRPAAKVPTAEEIVDQLQRHMPNADLDMVRRAYDYASAAHAGQLRLSGDPYIMHPATVAYTLAEMGFDEHSVAAGIYEAECIHVTADGVEHTCYGDDALVGDDAWSIAEFVADEAWYAYHRKLGDLTDDDGL